MKCECGKTASSTIYAKNGQDLIFFCCHDCLYKYLEKRFKEGTVLAARVSE